MAHMAGVDRAFPPRGTIANNPMTVEDPAVDPRDCLCAAVLRFAGGGSDLKADSEAVLDASAGNTRGLLPRQPHGFFHPIRHSPRR